MPSDPHHSAAEAILLAVLEAQRKGGDAVLCEALDLLAQGTGENRFRFAANVIRGTKLGRHAIDDRAWLRRIAGYPPGQRREAVSIVARQVAGAEASDKRVAAIARRLRRKLRENETDKLVMSISSVA
jgi:hypothetical protein